MWALFRKRKRAAPAMVGVWQRIGNAVEGKQRKAADYLNGKTGHWGKRQLKMLMLVCCVFFGGGALLVIWQAFHSADAVPEVQTIRKPDGLLKNTTPSTDMGLTDVELRNIRALRRHLDSLQQTTLGREQYESIARHRPGLLDSLAFIEKGFQQQLKTSDNGQTK